MSGMQTMLEAISNEVTARLQDPERAAAFSRQHLANLIWALAATNFPVSQQTFSAVCGAILTRADTCLPIEIANTVYACAKLLYYDAALLDTFATETTARISEFAPRDLVRQLQRSLLSSISELHATETFTHGVQLSIIFKPALPAKPPAPALSYRRWLHGPTANCSIPTTRC